MHATLVLRWSAVGWWAQHTYDQLHHEAADLPANLCDAQMLTFIELALQHAHKSLRLLQHPMDGDGCVGIHPADFPPFPFLASLRDASIAARRMVSEDQLRVRFGLILDEHVSS